MSATLVDVNRKLRGTVPLVASTVSQIGNVVVSTVKNGVPAAAEIAMSARPAELDPFT